MTFASLFSGVGGWDLGFEQAGGTALWACEIDKQCQTVLRARFPDATIYDDITTLDPRLVQRPDVLLCSPPCQAFSLAGLRGSMSDERGNLSLVCARFIDDLNATVTCIENVPGWLSTADNAFGTFLAALVGADAPLRSPLERGRWTNAGLVIGPRRAAAWRTLNAEHFGVAQRRNRVFLVASATPELCEKILLERLGLCRDFKEGGEAGEGVTGSLTARTGGGGGLGTDFECQGGLIPDVCPAVTSKWAKGTGGPIGDECQNLIPFDTTQITSKANRSHPHPGDPCHPLAAGAHAPAVAVTPLQEVGKRTGKSTDDPACGIGIGKEGDPIYTLQSGAQHGVAFSFKASHFTRGKDGAPSPLCPPLSADADKGDQEPIIFQPRVARNGRGAPDTICPALTGADAGATSDMRPCVAFSSKDHGADATEELSPTLRSGNHDASHMNGGCPPAVTVAAPLTASFAKHHGRTAGNNGGVDNMVAGHGVRRLTPEECEILQNFPVGWTNPPSSPQKDSPRYKQLGNAVNVACSRWIGKRVVLALMGLCSRSAD